MDPARKPKSDARVNMPWRRETRRVRQYPGTQSRKHVETNTIKTRSSRASTTAAVIQRDTMQTYAKRRGQDTFYRKHTPYIHKPSTSYTGQLHRGEAAASTRPCNKTSRRRKKNLPKKKDGATRQHSSCKKNKTATSMILLLYYQ